MLSGIINVILKRRSIRNFKQEEVPKEVLLKLVEAARWAPSGSNIQPWYFIIVNNKDILEQIDSFSPGLLGRPPSIVVFCSDKRMAFEKGGKIGKEVLYLMDIAMAAENLMLQATKERMGTCAVRSFNVMAVKKILELPEHISPELIVSIGYAVKEVKSPVKRTLEEISFFNKWGGEVK